MMMVLGLSACGNDGGSGGDAAGSDAERYCELVAELEVAGREAYAEVEADANATEEDFVAASRAFTESSQEEFDELIEVAPAEIKDDVRILIESIRGQAGEGPEVPTDEASPAEQRIESYEGENC